jgi:hypothetical protein
VHALADPTDLVAIVLLVIFSLRRLDVKATDPRAFPTVTAANFDQWRARALRCKSIAINACFLKVAANLAWFYFARAHVPRSVLAVGGFTIFAGWVLALTYAWWLSSSTKMLAAQLGIVVGKRVTTGTGSSSGAS